jgi:hypothetical protein
MTKIIEKDKNPSTPSKYTIKVGNYVPGLVYLLGPYKLPVIFENKQYVVQTRARTHFSFFY